MGVREYFRKIFHRTKEETGKSGKDIAEEKDLTSEDYQIKDKEEPGDQEKKEKEEKEKEEEEGTFELDIILQFIGLVASRGLSPELKEEFINKYIQRNEAPLTIITWDKSIYWLLKYIKIMPDWQKFLIGCGILVGNGVWLRIEFSKRDQEIKTKLKGKEKGKSSGEPKK